MGSDSDEEHVADGVGVDAASIRTGSGLTSGVYNLVLHGLVQESPGIAIVHVPVDRVFAWARVGSDEAGAIIRQWWAEVNQPDAPFVLFHITDDSHYCALLLDVAVWKAGPPAPSVSSQPAARRSVTKQQGSSALPFLHVDTLHTVCAFAADQYRLLVALGAALDSIFHTSWHLTATSAVRNLRTARMAQQEDDWSCGYHLLHLWHTLFQRTRSANSSKTSIDCSSHNSSIICSCSSPTHSAHWSPSPSSKVSPLPSPSITPSKADCSSQDASVSSSFSLSSSLCDHVDAACPAAALPASRLVAFVRRRFAASQRAQQQQVSSTTSSLFRHWKESTLPLKLIGRSSLHFFFFFFLCVCVCVCVCCVVAEYPRTASDASPCNATSIKNLTYPSMYAHRSLQHSSFT